MDEDFEMKCLGELAQLRNNATANEMIALSLTSFEEYVSWRKQFPRAEPWEFYLRPGAPDVIAYRKQMELEILKSMINKQQPR